VKKKILLIAPFNNPHIVPCYRRVRSMSNNRVEIIVLRSLSDERLKMGWPELREEDECLALWRRKKAWFRFICDILNCDLVVFPGVFHNPVLPLLHFIRRLARRPVVLWSEAFLGHPRSEKANLFNKFLKSVIIRLLNSRSYILLAIGPESEVDYRKLGATKWRVYQFLFTVEPLGPRNRGRATIQAGCGTNDAVSDCPVRLVYCGSLNRRKGVDLLVEALTASSLRSENWSLDVIGDGPLRHWMIERIDGVGLSQKVRFHGYLARREATSLMCDGDVLVLPSRFDGWGAVVNEGAEAGLALLISDRVGARRPFLDEGITGVSFESGNVYCLGLALRRLVANRWLVDSMKRESGKKGALYSVDRVSSDLTRLSDGLLAESQKQFQGDVIFPVEKDSVCSVNVVK